MNAAAKVGLIAALGLNVCVTYADSNKAGLGEPERVKAEYEKNRKSKKVVLEYGPLYDGNRMDEAMAKWRENRFGQFIHEGLYAIPGGVWEGKAYSHAAEFLKASARVSKEEWEGLCHQFSIEKFNTKERAAT